MRNQRGSLIIDGVIVLAMVVAGATVIMLARARYQAAVAPAPIQVAANQPVVSVNKAADLDTAAQQLNSDSATLDSYVNF